MMMELKEELMRLGKRQTDLVREINKRGIQCSQNDVCYALQGFPRRKYDLVRSESAKIIEEWKAAAGV